MKEGLLSIIIIIVVIVSLFFLGIFILKYLHKYNLEKPNQSENLNQKASESLNTLSPNQNEINNNGSEAQISKPQPISGASGGGSSAQSQTNNPTQIPENVDPRNIYGSPCGSFFREYAICAGTCPSGKCVNEQDSCYCK